MKKARGDQGLKASRPQPELEFHPDAWDRFRRAIHAVAKAGPQHREAPKAKRRKKATSLAESSSRR